MGHAVYNGRRPCVQSIGNVGFQWVRLKAAAGPVNMGKRGIVALGFTVVVLVGLLAAGLQTLEFRAGLPMPDAGVSETGEQVHLPFPHAFLERLLDTVPWITIGLVILGVVVFRRELFQEFVRMRVLIAFLVLLALLGMRPWLNQSRDYEEEPVVVEEELREAKPPELWQPTVPSPEHWVEDRTRQPPVSLPEWVPYLAAVAVVVPMVWLGWRLVRRTARRHRKEIPEDGLRGAAAQATAELRARLSVEEVVVRCWARMAEILAVRVGGRDPSLTPRELTSFLARRGVRHEAIMELTGLFEEVRYGAKDDAPRRERALAALAAIEEAYGAA